MHTGMLVADLLCPAMCNATLCLVKLLMQLKSPMMES